MLLKMRKEIKNPLSHGGDLTKEAELYGLKPESIIDFSASINPFLLPSYIKDLIKDNFKGVLSYPDKEGKELVSAIEKYLGVERKFLAIGNGSIELIFDAVRVFNIKKALIFGPTFSEYERAVILNKGKADYIFQDDRNEFNIDIEKINISKKYDAVFICNPNNPTGSLLAKKSIIRFIKKLPKTTLVIIDEVFMDFVRDAGKYSLSKEVKNFKNLIIIRSLTKFFSIPGLRAGYAAASQDLILKLKLNRIPWSVNFFAQIIGRRLLSDKDYIRESMAYMEREKEFLFRNLARIQAIKPFYPNSNFILCKILKRHSSGSLKDILAGKSILIRDCSNFKGLDNRFFRVAVKDRWNNLVLLKELKKVFI